MLMRHNIQNKLTTIKKIKLNRDDFWRRSARMSRKDKTRNTLIKQKMKETKSLYRWYINTVIIVWI
jgi:hypothetical protein